MGGTIAGLAFSCLAALGMVQAWLGLRATRRFAMRAARRPPEGGMTPPVTILKPLYGDEPLLEQALESFFTQDYPAFQIVFGVTGPDDPAVAMVRMLQHRYPARDVTLVIDGTAHGVNRKISNLINMLPAASHATLVVADSDVHAAADYLTRLVSALQQPGLCVVTTLYAGRPAHHGLAGALGASYINHTFLPGVLLARELGRQDCLGATMALDRMTLEAMLGFSALVDHLADDAMLGKLVRRAGGTVRLATTVPATTVPETGVRALLQHELRWARTIRSQAPAGHALSLVQFPMTFAALAVLATGFAPWTLVVFGASWAARAAAAAGVARALQLPVPVPVWWLPLRDLMCSGVVVASYHGGSVKWRGHTVPIGQPSRRLRTEGARAYRRTEHALGAD